MLPLDFPLEQQVAKPMMSFVIKLAFEVIASLVTMPLILIGLVRPKLRLTRQLIIAAINPKQLEV